MSWFGKWFKVEAVVTEADLDKVIDLVTLHSKRLDLLNIEINYLKSENASLNSKVSALLDRPIKPMSASLTKDLEEARQRKARETEANRIIENRRDDGVDTAFIIAGAVIASSAYDDSSSSTCSSYDSSSSGD